MEAGTAVVEVGGSLEVTYGIFHGIDEGSFHGNDEGISFHGDCGNFRGSTHDGPWKVSLLP